MACYNPLKLLRYSGVHWNILHKDFWHTIVMNYYNTQQLFKMHYLQITSSSLVSLLLIKRWDFGDVSILMSSFFSGVILILKSIKTNTIKLWYHIYLVRCHSCYYLSLKNRCSYYSNSTTIQYWKTIFKPLYFIIDCGLT